MAFLKIVKDPTTFLTLFHGTYFFFCVVLIQVIINRTAGLQSLGGLIQPPALIRVKNCEIALLAAYD